MKSHLLAWSFVFCLPALLSAQEEVKWERFSNKDAKCSILMPGKVTSQKQVQPNTTVYMFLSPFADNMGVCLLAYNDLPVDGDLDAAAKAIVGVPENVARTLNGKVLSNKEITFGKLKGREFEIEIPLGIYRSRVYVVGTRLYQNTIVAKKEITSGDDAKKFFESFKVEK